MKMTSLPSLAVTGLLMGAVGCGGTSDSGALDTWSAELEGVYRIDAWTRNEAACTEGPSVLKDGGDYMVLVHVTDPLGASIEAMECADPAACSALVTQLRASRVTSSSAFIYDFRTADASGVTGVLVTTGYSGGGDGTCPNAMLTNIALNRPADGQVQIESRSVVVDHPAHADGSCWTDDTVSAAAGKPCNQLEEMEATRIETL